MLNRNYRTLIYFIAFVIAVTLAIQVYWNYRNYQAGKQQLINEVQTALDKAVDDYYTLLAKENTVGLVMNSSPGDSSRNKLDNLFKQIDFSKKGLKGIDSIKPGSISHISVFRGPKADSLADAQLAKNNRVLQPGKVFQIKSSDSQQPDDVLKNKLNIFTSKIVVSFQEDTLDLKRLDSLLSEEFRRKELGINYGFNFISKDSLKQSVNPEIENKTELKTTTNSTLLPARSNLTLFFTNISGTIMKRNLLGIFLSALLISAVIACLLFLLKIINRQKQLAEVKNDLISNITHEFKTPIATIGVALEGIQNFNRDNDPEKTERYVSTSTLQLEKLNGMVEKLLETATLDGGEFSLIKETIDPVEILASLLTKFRTLAPEKTFEMQTPSTEIRMQADPFHLENAFSNILDNAVKYGGEVITVSVEKVKAELRISIADTGKTLRLAETRQLFEKFYRVPKGNTHDVKGFGIGLYYTKKIVEKHRGQIAVELEDQTKFVLTFPND